MDLRLFFDVAVFLCCGVNSTLSNLNFRFLFGSRYQGQMFVITGQCRVCIQLENFQIILSRPVVPVRKLDSKPSKTLLN